MTRICAVRAFRRLRKAAVLSSLSLVGSLGWAAEQGGPLPRLFPADNWWNVSISSAPIDSSSNAYIRFINTPNTQSLQPSFGGDAWPGSDESFGNPYIIVDRSQPKKTVAFQYWNESDGVGYPFYPIPDEAILQPHWIQSGWPGVVDARQDHDRHMLIVDRDNNYLYELWNVWFDLANWQWRAGGGAFFDMNTNNRRPEGWTSADASGLAILPGLIRYDEVYGAGEIEHAFRTTIRVTNGYVYPASHLTSWVAGALPMGARLRLKADVDISHFSWEVQKIFRAMKKYGLIVADNGGDLGLSGTYDRRWDNDLLNPQFRQLTAWDFEVIQLGYRPASASPPPPSPGPDGGSPTHEPASGTGAPGSKPTGGPGAAAPETHLEATAGCSSSAGAGSAGLLIVTSILLLGASRALALHGRREKRIALFAAQRAAEQHARRNVSRTAPLETTFHPPDLEW